MIVPVFTPATRINGTNVDDFAATVHEFVTRYRGMVLDCSGVVWIDGSGMRVLEVAARAAPITLVNPSPAVYLMATTFAHEVLCRFDRLAPVPAGTRPPRRPVVLAVPPKKVAS